MKKVFFVPVALMVTLFCLEAKANPFSNFKPYEVEKAGSKQSEVTPKQSSEEGEKQNPKDQRAQSDE